MLCIENIDNRWIQLFEYLAPVGQICVVPGQCAADYMEWFYMIFQPFMSPTQLGDPPRHPSVMHNDTFVELDIPQHPVVATTMDTAPVDAPGHAEQPRHVLVKYKFNLLCYSFYLNMKYVKLFLLLSMS